MSPVSSRWHGVMDHGDLYLCITIKDHEKVAFSQNVEARSRFSMAIGASCAVSTDASVRPSVVHNTGENGQQARA